MDEDLRYEALSWNRSECNRYLIFLNTDCLEQLTTFQLKESMTNAIGKGHHVGSSHHKFNQQANLC